MDRVVRFCPNIHFWAGSFFVYDLSMHFSEQIQHQLHFPSPTKNYPSGAQLCFPRNFLALKIVGKAQECDLSVTGHLIVDKPFRWLISCSVFGMLWSTPSLHTDPTWSLPTARADAFQQTHTCVHFAHWTLQEGFLAHCSHQAAFVFRTLTRSHLWESRLFPVSIPLWLPELPEAMSSFHKSQTPQNQDLTADTAGWLWLGALGLCWFGVECFQQPPRCLASPGSWSSEPWSTAHHTLTTSYQASPKPICSTFWKPVRKVVLAHLR